MGDFSLMGDFSFVADLDLVGDDDELLGEWRGPPRPNSALLSRVRSGSSGRLVFGDLAAEENLVKMLGNSTIKGRRSKWFYWRRERPYCFWEWGLAAWISSLASPTGLVAQVESSPRQELGGSMAWRLCQARV